MIKQPVLPISAFLICLLASAGIHAGSESILIIKGNDNRFFNSTVEMLVHNTQPHVKFTITTVKSLQQNRDKINDPQIIITLGHGASKYIVGKAESIPVIHGYMTEFQYTNHEKRLNHYCVLLEQPLHRYLKFIQLLLTVNRVGIIKDQKNKIDVDTIRKIKQHSQIQIDQKIFNPGDNPVNTVRNLLKNNDVLLSLPEPNVYNKQSLKGILLASYRLGKPVISYSPAHVKSGALAAIYTSPENIGVQLAGILNKIIKDKNFKPEPFYYASNFDISINQRVAQSLNLQLPDREVLLKNLHQDQLK